MILSSFIIYFTRHTISHFEDWKTFEICLYVENALNYKFTISIEIVFRGASLGNENKEATMANE